ncbi:hypothetical protein IT157_01300 [bacterium]|nr:hypothetical protein [bacterium]
MKPVIIFISALALVLLSSGCYTKLYRVNMEQNGPFSTNELYQRYDSTAIDTTLTEPQYVDTYPNDYGWDNSGWNSWGRPRGYTRWGFDFNRFSPDYYWSYYGYYDYYGRPWWDNYHYRNPWWYGGGGGSSGPAEPPSTRPGRRMRDGEGSPPLYNPGGGSSAPSYQPPATQPQPVVPPTRKDEDDNSQKRNGKRRS